MIKRIGLCILSALLLAVSLAPWVSAETDAPPVVEAGITAISKYGNIKLTIAPESMTGLGYEPADIVLVRIGDAEMTMPIGTSYSDVDSGDPVCCFKTDSETGKEEVVLALNVGDLATTMGVAERRDIEADPGYEWVYDASATVNGEEAGLRGRIRDAPDLRRPIQQARGLRKPD